MDPNEMRERRKSLVAQAREIQTKADEESRELLVDEARQVEDCLNDADALGVRIEREERMRVVEEDARKPHSAPLRPETRQTYGEPTKFRSFGEQLVAAYRASQPGQAADPRLFTRAGTGLNEGVSSDGGFLVQTDFAAELIKRTYETGVLASRCKRIPISGNANGITINGIDETSRVAGSRWGGVRGYWAAEAGALTGTAPKFRKIDLKLNKLTGLCYSTDELLQDASALESVVMQAFSEEFGFLLDDAIIRGTGAGMPLGFTAASGPLITVAIEAGQALGVVSENIVKMFSRLYVKSRANAVWLVNQDVEPFLQLMSMGTGGAAGMTYMPAGGLSGVPYATLIGKPVIAIEQCATCGTPTDIMLVDLSQYVLADKGGMQGASSIHVRFVNDESVFRFVYRVDGQPVWSAALTPAQGSNTVSPFVALATRP